VAAAAVRHDCIESGIGQCSMIPISMSPRARAERSSRLRTAPNIVAMLVCVSVGAALSITISPMIGAFLAAFITTFFLTEFVMPPTWGTVAPLLILFLTPADDVIALSGDRRGLFTISAGLALALTTLIRGRIRIHSRVQFLVPMLAIMYACVAALHASQGELRNTTFWVGAMGLWIWLDGRLEADPERGRRSLENAIIAIGAISGGVGLLQYVGVVNPSEWIPGYEPLQDTFTQLIGVRAVGLSGQSLRCGTLCMLGSGLGMIRIAFGTTEKKSVWLVLSVLASGAGLIVSGARGSWLALFLGATVALGATIQSRRLSGELVIRGSLVAVAVAGLVTMSGLGFLVRERLVGTAVAPASIGQRVMAFNAITDSLPDLPLIGVGPGGAASFLLHGGATVPNIENEYLIALVTGGPLAMIGLLTFCVFMVQRAFRDALTNLELGPLTLAVAVCLNIATYNLFSWSAGPPLFATVAALVLLSRGRSHRPVVDPCP